MYILSLVPVSLLVVVAIWFVWPLIIDPIYRLIEGEVDELEEDVLVRLSRRAAL